MKAFVIHRLSMQREAKVFLRGLVASHQMHIDPVFLRRSAGSKWQQNAKQAIRSAELVVVYDTEACSQSENTTWEIEQSTALGKPVVSMSREDIESGNANGLFSLYNFDGEFEGCFREQVKEKSQLMEIYKVMVASSEELINRRQTTNKFFITAMGVILAAVGLAVRGGIASSGYMLLLFFPVIFGLMLCVSWANLIENYGKLNIGKFKVIHELENQLGIKAFAAEWVALGKGMRREKYRSFTNTERRVPTLFLWLFVAISLVIAVVLITDNWQPISSWIAGIFALSE